MDINYELYKMFYKVAKTGSFTRVAEECYISQSAVTQAMKKLENQLGGVLFIRSKTGVTLTPEGQTLYEFLDESLETLNSAENLFSKYKNLEKGKIRIYCSSTLVDVVLFKPLLEFAKDYPNIEISVLNSGDDDSIEKIATGTVDISIFNMPIKNDYENVKVEEIADSDMCFFTNASYGQKLTKKKFDLKDISHYELCLPNKGSNARNWLEENFDNLKIKITPKYEFMNERILASFVKENDVVGYTNEAIAKKVLGDDFCLLAKDFHNERKEVGIAYLNEKITSMATIKFVEYLKKYNK